MQPVTSITILYDADCGLCIFAKDWIGSNLLWSGSSSWRKDPPKRSARFRRSHRGTGCGG